jgi:hypothetical protein
MSTVLTGIRLPPEMLNDLKAVAKQESERRGEYVSWARLLRECAAYVLKRARSGQPPLPCKT